jgi:RNA polymerase sigma-70 factor (ECF subfamily)
MNSEGISYFPRSLTEKAEADLLRPGYSSSKAQLQPKAASATVDSGENLAVQTDSDLLLAIGNGSRDALSTLFKRHAKLIHRVCQRILRDETEAEDLVQDVFVYLLHKASLYDPAKGGALSWMIQMTYHRAFDRKKHLGIRGHYDRAVFNDESLESQYGQVSITEIAAKSLLERLRRELSEDQFRVLDLHLFHGYSLAEIATNAGQNLGAVRNQYYRGLKRVHAYIFPTGNGEETIAPPEHVRGVSR